MPRLGAVTRSMTRGAAVAMHSTPEHGDDEGVEAENTVNQGATAPHERTINKSWDPEPSGADSPIPSNISSSAMSAEVVTQNRITILHLEQDGILAPGILTIEPSGKLHADLAVEDDRGTMVGLFPSMAPPPDTDGPQIPSWLRDYLVGILNVHGCGPPALCRAFYDHLKDSQDDVGINTSVRTAESHLAYAAISLRYAVEEVQSFVGMQRAFEDTYEEEVRMVIRTIRRLVGYEGEDMPKDLRMLVEIAEMGTVMKEALNEPLESLVITPYNQLLEKLELVSKALRMELDRVDQGKEKVRVNGRPPSTPDSGIGGFWS